MKMVAPNFLFNLHIKLLAIRLGWNDSHFIQSQQQKWSQVPRNVSGSKFYHSDFFLRNVNNGDSRSHVKAKKIKRLKRIILLSNISSTKGHKCKGPFSHIFLISHRTFVQVMELFLDLHRNVWQNISFTIFTIITLFTIFTIFTIFTLIRKKMLPISVFAAKFAPLSLSVINVSNFQNSTFMFGNRA